MNAKVINSEKWTYMDHLGKIEAWLFSTSKKLDKNPTMKENAQPISESCLHVVENFQDVIVNGFTLEKKLMIIVTTLNTLINVYALDQSRFIMSDEYLRRMIKKFTYELLYVCETIRSNEQANDTDTPDLLSNKFTDSLRYKRCAADIFNALFNNFAGENLLNQCLKSLFSNTTPSPASNVHRRFHRSIPFPSLSNLE